MKIKLLSPFFKAEITQKRQHFSLATYSLETYLNAHFSVYEDEQSLVFFCGKLHNQPANMAQFFLETYANDKQNFAHFLDGHYAVWLFDKNNNAFEVFRDPMGLQPIYYHFSENELIFSTHLKTLSDSLLIKNADNEYIILDLEFQIPDTYTATCYEQIKRIPANSKAIFTEKGLLSQEKIYHFFKIKAGSNKKPYPAILEEFRTLLQATVQKNVPAEEPAFLQYSGGLDSTGLVAIAHALGKPHQQAIYTYAMGLDPDQKDNEFGDKDDQAVLDLLWEDDKIPLPKIISANYKSTIEEELASDLLSNPLHRQAIFLTKTCQDIQEKKGNYLISGFGGDECITFNQQPEFLMNALKKGKITNFLQEFKAIGFKKTAFLLIYEFPLLQKMARVLFPNKDFQSQATIPKIINREIKITDNQLFTTLNEMIAHYLTTPYIAHRIENEKELAENFGVEMRYPFFDLKLIEFFLGLPSAMKMYQHTGRLMYKNAIRKWVTSERWHKLGKSRVSTVPVMSLQMKYRLKYHEIDLETAKKALPSEISNLILPMKKPKDLTSFEATIYYILWSRVKTIAWFLGKKDPTPALPEREGWGGVFFKHNFQ